MCLCCRWSELRSWANVSMLLNTYFHIASSVSDIGISDLCVSLPISFTFYIRKQKRLSELYSLLCCPLQICWLVMSGERLPNCFSSTPLKDFHPSKDFGDGILSDEEDTFSLLSPIYHDSFDSDEEELRSTPDQQTTSPRERDDSRLSISPFRCCSKALVQLQFWLVCGIANFISAFIL